MVPSKTLRMLHRTIEVSGTEEIWHKVAAGESIEKLPDGTYIINDESYFIDFSDGSSLSPVVRQTDGIDELLVKIPAVSPPFEAKARVIWCVARGTHYEMGIEFCSSEDAYTARMVEQICHIEHYRLWVKEVEGRDLDSEGAASEWIGRYAKDFPYIA